MGFKVQVYIYDLTQGMARSLGPALLGKNAISLVIFYNETPHQGGRWTESGTRPLWSMGRNTSTAGAA